MPKRVSGKDHGSEGPAADNSVNGWVFTTKTGLYGTKYLQRALVTAIGLGANRPQDAVYPVGEGCDGQRLSGANRYVVHFPKGQLPPAKGFWSITMYNEEYFFVDEQLNRYTVSSRLPFQYNPDGSLDLYIQHADPGGAKRPTGCRRRRAISS